MPPCKWLIKYFCLALQCPIAIPVAISLRCPLLAFECIRDAMILPILKKYPHLKKGTSPGISVAADKWSAGGFWVDKRILRIQIDVCERAEYFYYYDRFSGLHNGIWTPWQKIIERISVLLEGVDRLQTVENYLLSNRFGKWILFHNGPLHYLEWGRFERPSNVNFFPCPMLNPPCLTPNFPKLDSICFEFATEDQIYQIELSPNCKINERVFKSFDDLMVELRVLFEPYP